jgi:hypothetical protein
MKLTKLHVFLILLVALTLCYTLGMCYKEGFKGSNNKHSGDSASKTPDNFVRQPQGETYRDGYSDYYANEDDATVSATNESKGLRDSYDNKYYNPDDRAHRSSDGRYNDNTYDNDEMNGGDENDPSDMITSSFKHTKYNKAYNNSSDREKTNNNMYDSVSQGAMNGSMYSNSDSGSGSDLGSGGGGGGGSDSSNGITRDQIPNGQEDMYILKSQIVAPVCPACPPFPPINCDKLINGGKKCPPCKPCGRCPEPAFECKKVPNYSSSSLMGQLPIPWADKL